MPIAMRIDGAGRRVNTRAEGLVTYAELSEHLDERERHGPTDVPELFDATGATTDLSGDQVRALVRRVDALLRRKGAGPRAIVADNDVCFGMARMYQLLAEPEGIAVGVFRTVAAAERWLDR